MPYRSNFSSGYAKDGSVGLTLPRRLFPELAEQRVSASANPLVIVDALTAYLEHFPHGCTEQVVSQVFPLVGLLTHPAYRSNRVDIEGRFSQLIDRLRERQLADGGFSFWPGGQVAADFPSVYVMHFLLETRELGYTVPSDMLQRGKDFLGDVAARDVDSLAAACVRAQAIYLLTRMGQTTTNHLVDLQETLETGYQEIWKKDLAAVYMAATYRLLKMDADAEQLVGHYRLGTPGNEDVDDFNWPLTRDAQVLYLLCRHFEQQAKDVSGDDVRRLIDPIFKGNINTIGASYSILALGAYGRLKLTNERAETVRKKTAGQPFGTLSHCRLRCGCPQRVH
jgi:hypothetical protein